MTTNMNSAAAREAARRQKEREALTDTDLINRYRRDPRLKYSDSRTINHPLAYGNGQYEARRDITEGRARPVDEVTGKAAGLLREESPDWSFVAYWVAYLDVVSQDHVTGEP